MQIKNAILSFKTFGISGYLVWAVPELLRINVVNVPFLVSVTPWNMCSRFTSFRIICFTLICCSYKKFLSIKSTKNSSAGQLPQGAKMKMNWVHSLSWHTICPTYMVWKLVKLRHLTFLSFYYRSQTTW